MSPQELAQWVHQMLSSGGPPGNNPGMGQGGGGPGGQGSNANGTPVSPGGRGYFTMPGWADAASQLASFAPFPYGTLMSLARAGGKAYNMFGSTDPNRASMGIPGLSFMQGLGGLFGSGYGNFQNPLIANAEQTAGSIPPGWGDTAITANGGPTPGWLFGLLGGGDPSMSYANDQPGLPGSSALDQHQITLALQQQANGTLPTFQPATPASPALPAPAPVTTSPAWWLQAHGIVPGSADDPGAIGGGTTVDRNGNAVQNSYGGAQTGSPYGAGDTTSRNSVTGMLGHV
jgi:hypothetical protein